MPPPVVRLFDMAPEWVRPGARTVRRLALASLVVLTGIVVTGAAVRLTGSGLGCPSWPECSPGSYVPRGELGWHGVIEFGNRLLTFVVGVVVLATIAATLLRRPWRRDLSLLAGGLLLGVVAQGLLGGVTVLTGLHPLTVAAHFLLSMVLIAAAVGLHDRATGGGRPAGRGELVALSWAIVGVAAATLVVGTLVTGSGPHSGDPDAQRLPFDPETVAQLHADLVFLLVGLTLASVPALRAGGASPVARRRALVLLGVVLAQGVIGYAQYLTGLPVVVVGVHVLGACLVWIAALRLHLALLAGSPGPPPHRATAVEAAPEAAPRTGREASTEEAARTAIPAGRPAGQIGSRTSTATSAKSSAR